VRFSVSGINLQHFAKISFGSGEVTMNERALGSLHTRLPVGWRRLTPERSRSKQPSHAAEGSSHK
jgi:hypothetical protein